MSVAVQRWLSLQFRCWHFYERLWFMDLILTQISKSHVTRLVCNKMLIEPYIIKCKSIYATIYYTNSKLQCHLYVSSTMQCASIFIWLLTWAGVLICSNTNLDSSISQKYTRTTMHSLCKASVYLNLCTIIIHLLVILWPNYYIINHW